MNRSVPCLKSGLRVVALAAVIGGQSACVRTSPVSVGPNTTNRTSLSVSSAAAAQIAAPTSVDGESGPPQIVIRDYWRSPRASVIAWNEDESWQGLRAGVRRDGSIPYDHVLYFSLSSIPNLRAFAGANWYAFSDGLDGGYKLKVYGVTADRSNCQGNKGCTPYLTFQARVPDSLLRGSHDSLVVKVVSFDGSKTEIALRGGLISSYLATIDSVSSARRTPRKAGSNW